MLGGCTSLKKLILPKVTYLCGLGKTDFDIIDIGKNLISMPDYGSRFNINTTGIIRNAPVTVERDTVKVRVLYVPSEYVEEYKIASKWSVVAAKTYAIGGAEWTAEFGSADEYADLTEQEYADTYGWLAELEQG